MPLYLASALAVLWPSLSRFRPIQGAMVHLRYPVSAVTELVAVGWLFLSFFLLKLVGIHPSGTDDNIYFYMATRLSEGAIPYRDFFFPHPPVHLLVPAVVFAVTGFGIVQAKLIPVVSQVLAGVLLYATVRRASRLMAAVSVLMYLMAYEVLQGSTDMNGENLICLFLALALFLSSRARPAWAGVAAGMALGSGFYSLAGVATLWLGVWLSQGRRAGLRFIGSAVGTFVVVCLPFFVASPSGFIEGVFVYHSKKPLKGGGKLPLFESPNPLWILRAVLNNFVVYLGSKPFLKALYFHAPQFWAAGIGAGVFLLRLLWRWLSQRGQSLWRLLDPRETGKATESGMLKLGILGCLSFLLELGALNEVYDFYMVPFFIFLALGGGYGFSLVTRLLQRAGDWRMAMAALILTLCFWSHLPAAYALNARLWPEELREAGQVVTYDFRPPLAFQGLAKLTKAMFFVDHRIKGRVTPYYLHYMWNKRLWFHTAREVAQYIRRHTSPDETLTGASTLAPLVALYAGRRMAAEEADTNSKRFKSGMLTEDEFFNRVCKDNVRFILSAPRSHFTGRLMAKNRTIRRYFTRDREFVDTWLLHYERPFAIVLYRRREQVQGLPKGMVCAP